MIHNLRKTNQVSLSEDQALFKMTNKMISFTSRIIKTI